MGSGLMNYHNYDVMFKADRHKQKIPIYLINDEIYLADL